MINFTSFAKACLATESRVKLNVSVVGGGGGESILFSAEVKFERVR